jgi:hypothetical protein
MTTSLNSKVTAKEVITPVVHVIRATITTASAGFASIGTAIAFGALPNGAAVLGAAVWVYGAGFTGTTPTVSIGNAADAGGTAAAASYLAAQSLSAIAYLTAAPAASGAPVSAAANAAPIDRVVTYTIGGTPTIPGAAGATADLFVWYVLPLKPATNP